MPDQSNGKLKNTEIEKLFGCYLCNYSINYFKYF